MAQLDRGELAELGVDDGLIAKRERLDGERALAFLAELPALVARWEARLELEDPRVMPGGVLSAALACRRARDGEPVVLKLSSQAAGNAQAEAAALALWGGHGACALLFEAEHGRVMLLQPILPGTSVEPRDDRADARRAGDLLRTLHRPSPEQIPDAAEELRWRFERAHEKLDGPSHARGLLTHRDLDDAYRATLALHENRQGTVLCHGDFINKNLLLDHQGNWWAIDPRPCVGDPCLDAAFWALAHRPGLAVRERCAMIAAAVGLDGDRVWRWARAFAVSEAVLVTDADRARAHHRVLAT
jgi:streptomycin 6-kinase